MAMGHLMPKFPRGIPMCSMPLAKDPHRRSHTALIFSPLVIILSEFVKLDLIIIHHDFLIILPRLHVAAASRFEHRYYLAGPRG